MDYQIHLLCRKLSEITDASVAPWSGADVQSISASEIQEITRSDEKPFYVEFVALYERLSSNRRLYTESSVKSCVDALLGVNMYKGHEEPGSESWKYREPVGKVVASRLGTVEVDGKKVSAAIGKAYISDSDQKLRSDIAKKLAGNVSILGNAKMISKPNDTIKTVTQIHIPLKSVDFCNPGTGGLPLASVTAIVSEMSAQEDDGQENQMKLTKEQLLAEYGDIIAAIVSEKMTAQIAEIAAMKAGTETEKVSLNAKISEMGEKVKSLEADKVSLTAKLGEETNKRLTSELTIAVDAAIEEMCSKDEPNKKLIQLAAKRVGRSLLDGDVQKSVAAFKSALTTEIESLSEVAEMFSNSGEADDSRVVDKSGNRKAGGKKLGVESILADSLLASKNKRS